ncbi:MAG TPA: hypothetical protein PKN96_03255 [Flavobacterium sp.]|uniref:hypothetical protein n=1 Tax=Flavobacterium sp. TaxID=239 RepID=UPI002C0B2607|nr:hypothetical protein [Flavobacterium sp.]HNP32289.1 hypothetical protein [Flavobacterium sp.]
MINIKKQYDFRLYMTIVLLLFNFSTFGQQKEIAVSHKFCGLKVKNKRVLDSRIPEGSGLVAWNGKLWTHNDSGRPALFCLDTIDYKIIKEYNLGVPNIDWEEISQDDNYLYMGNFGNNLGKRNKLPIYRISKEALLQNKIVLDSITFEWPEKINYDCEAMVPTHDSIFLFTKEWKGHRCQIFKIPAQPSHHIAEYVATLKNRTLITGASYRAEDNRILLIGYSRFLSPRILMLSLSENKNMDIRKVKLIRINQNFRQTEGIASFNGTDYFIISEGTDLHLWKTKPKLYKVKIPLSDK